MTYAKQDVRDGLVGGKIPNHNICKGDQILERGVLCKFRVDMDLERLDFRRWETNGERNFTAKSTPASRASRNIDPNR